jgi:cellulose synthase/poly-beta-1,6-N-acetylglucosamine synthase-like glycosyltransferase
MAKKKTHQPPKSDFDSVDDLDICTFTSEPFISGKCISSFSFDDDSNDDVYICNTQNTDIASRT